MAIKVEVSDPDSFLKELPKIIEKNQNFPYFNLAFEVDEEGDIAFRKTNSPHHFEGDCWLRPEIISEKELVFKIIGRKDEKLSIGTYSICNSELISLLLSNFDKEIINITILNKDKVYDMY
jgi:hypothetical protein